MKPPPDRESNKFSLVSSLIRRLRKAARSTPLDSNPAMIRSIEFSNCVSYCAFPFGRGYRHPYEQYLHHLVDGDGVVAARRELIDFLKRYRPRHLGEALGVELRRSYAFWSLPWNLGWRAMPSSGRDWFESADRVPDIMTYFSEEGILSFRIEKEFYWIERALRNMKRYGYSPQTHTYVQAIELVSKDRGSRYLLEDGNHRVAAMVVLDQGDRIDMKISRSVHESEIDDWSLVTAGHYTVEDARSVFFAYFDGNPNGCRNPNGCGDPNGCGGESEATILSPPGWASLYYRNSPAKP